MTAYKKIDALAIAAHPDDVEFSCGGTLLKLVSMGYSVGILDMARGELGTRGSAEIRAREAEAAGRIIGVTVRDNLELPDGHIVFTEEFRRRMVRKIRQYRPTIIFTQYWEDPHPDHVHTCQIVREAAHLAGLAKYDVESGQERFRPRAVAHFNFPRTSVPSFIVDISDVAKQKWEAALCYKSQLHDPASKEPQTNLSSELFLKQLEARSRYWGALIGVEFGEAFVVREALNVDDPVALLSRTMNMYS
jgi:bacillithiol biosynthesis deacetylase BshB1